VGKPLTDPQKRKQTLRIIFSAAAIDPYPPFNSVIFEPPRMQITCHIFLSPNGSLVPFGEVLVRELNGS
jgi:hypothetical protein